MKKMITGMILAAAVMAAGASAAIADAPDRFDSQGISFEIPEDIRDLVTVVEDEPDTIVSVYETASVEAAKALGEDYSGAGWLFSIGTVSEAEMEQLRCGAMDGMEPFAEDDDTYYIYCHPTDVSYVRETTEEMKADQDQWTKLNEWAAEDVRKEILKNNHELDAVTYSNTELDMYLAKIAFRPDTKYEIRTLEYPDLDASALRIDDYIEDLTGDVYYKVADDAEAPDGEYIVLAFDEDGIRFDFFPGENLIREVKTLDDGEEYETLYEAYFEDADENAYEIMKEWCDAIANGETDD